MEMYAFNNLSILEEVYEDIHISIRKKEPSCILGKPIELPGSVHFAPIRDVVIH